MGEVLEVAKAAANAQNHRQGLEQPPRVAARSVIPVHVPLVEIATRIAAHVVLRNLGVAARRFAEHDQCAFRFKQCLEALAIGAIIAANAARQLLFVSTLQPHGILDKLLDHFQYCQLLLRAATAE